MPHVRWQGIDITGKKHTGRGYSPSRAHLDSYLFKKGIALTNYKPERYFSLFSPFSTAVKAELFGQLTFLLRAHFLLVDACGLVAHQMRNQRARALLLDVEQILQAGQSLHAALIRHSNSFDPFVIALLAAGEESGMLARATQMITSFFQMKALFSSKLRAAFLMPLCTFLFLILAVMLICGYIVPQMSSLYLSLGKEMPLSTQRLLLVGTFLTGRYLLLYGGVLLLTGMLIWRMRRTGRLGDWLDCFILKVPFFGSLLKDQLIVWWAQSLALLLEGGVPLFGAIEILEKSMPNSVFRRCLFDLKKRLSMGDSLSVSMELYPSFFSPDVRAFVVIGQEAEQLPVMLERVSVRYAYTIEQRLMRFSMVVQPACMILLGILVAGLIFSVYTPIVSLSSAI